MTGLAHFIHVSLTTAGRIIVLVTKAILAGTLIKRVRSRGILRRIALDNIGGLRVAGQTAEGNPALLLTEEFTDTLVQDVVNVHVGREA